MKVRELMTSPALSVAPATSLREVAKLLWGHRISGVPVVDGGRVVGVVSEADIVDKERGDDADDGRFRRLARRGRRRAALAHATTAGEAMHTPAVIADASMSDHGAAWLMSEFGIDRLPVLERGRLVGVITRADLTRAFARRDVLIAADIRREVIDPLFVPDVSVHVREGHVRLEGSVEREADRLCLPHAVAQVPGVITVDSRVGVPRDRAAATARRA